MLSLRVIGFTALCLFSSCFAAVPNSCEAKRPNIVFIFTDDQDLHLGSLNYMSSVKQELVAKGTSFTNHFATISQCCPSRSSLFRGQHGHNTNITHVSSPGGNYAKWLVSGENNDYLPFWLSKAGYRTEYIGKFLNGYNSALYKNAPKGWDMADILVEPWTYQYNTPVFSLNGATPVLYHGYHQTDVLRAKALSRLEYLTENQTKPFYLTVAPVSPHVEIPGLPVPLARHAHDFENATTPKEANFNPSDSFTQQKPSWLRNLTSLNDTQIARANLHFRRRIQALAGVDEIVQDVVDFLEKKNMLENTYIVYSTDNGYHLGQHRVAAGKTLPYREDTNLPFIVRGPGVPQGQTSRLPGAHLDLAPTFLDIACVESQDLPVFLDGRSLLGDWHNPTQTSNASSSHDILNVEFWGMSGIEAPGQKGSIKNSYKTLRIVGESASWLYSKWCTGDSELYNTKADPYELINLAIKPDTETQRLIHRLDALLMVTKSCNQDHCRNPWTVLQSSCESAASCPKSGSIFSDLDAAMASEYDSFFASLPRVQFKECLQFQDADNEEPYLPPSSRSLGRAHRHDTDNYKSPSSPGTKVPPNAVNQGTEAQRHTTIQEMAKTARNLTPAELGEDRAVKESGGQIFGENREWPGDSGDTVSR